MHKKVIGILMLLMIMIILSGAATAADPPTATASAKVNDKIEISATTNADLGTAEVGVAASGSGTITINSNQKWDLKAKGSDGGKPAAMYDTHKVTAYNSMIVEVAGDGTQGLKTLSDSDQKVVDAGPHNTAYQTGIVRQFTCKQTFDYVDPVPDPVGTNPGSYTITITWTISKHAGS